MHLFTAWPLPAQEQPALSPRDKLVVETILRLKEFKLETNPVAKESVLRYLRAQAGSDQYFELIERFRPAELAEELLQFCLSHAEDSKGARGAAVLVAMGQTEQLQQLAQANDAVQAVAAVRLLGHAAGKDLPRIMVPLIISAEASTEVRSAAIIALGRSIVGQRELLTLVSKNQLDDQLKFAAANVLLSSSESTIAAEAGKYLELPATADRQPLPTIAELVQRRGSVDAGSQIFRTPGTCINCHKLQTEGREVGPDLSTIGSKLSREAMYVAILDPSSAISHNFETYAALTDEGTVITGLLISQTDDEVTIRTSEGIDKRIDRASIEEMKKQPKSLMPQDLQRLMTVQQLVDLVEYLLTLRTANSGQ
ncbi:MAG: c-type cytochrome [Planctomycetales bacterium]|nr:c-type cytochrome [Planctomycetales bacterium]